MTIMTATEAQQNFGKLMNLMHKDPVKIIKYGRIQGVFISIDDFNFLESLEDHYWVQMAKEAEKEGFIGVEETKKLFDEILNEKD